MIAIEIGNELKLRSILLFGWNENGINEDNDEIYWVDAVYTSRFSFTDGVELEFRTTVLEKFLLLSNGISDQLFIKFQRLFKNAIIIKMKNDQEIISY